MLTFDSITKTETPLSRDKEKNGESTGNRPMGRVFRRTASSWISAMSTSPGWKQKDWALPPLALWIPTATPIKWTMQSRLTMTPPNQSRLSRTISRPLLPEGLAERQTAKMMSHPMK